MQFDIYDPDNAPEASRAILGQVREAYGFLPNLFGVFAESPAAAMAYASVGKAVEMTDLNPVQRQVVFLAVSVENAWAYCVAAHSAIATGARIPPDALAALREGGKVSDPSLRALAEFARSVVRHRGWVPDEDLQAFVDAGFGRRQVLDVITIVAMKTLSNYTNHIAETPLDDAFAGQVWEPGEHAA